MNPRANDASPARAPDVRKFENAHQLGGIRTGTLDAPGAGGGSGVRVALFDTGSGLRFTVALDRGGDIVDACYNDIGLAFLTPNGLRPPSHAYHFGNDWLRNWPGGLVTTCGPEFIGGARSEQGIQTSLHGRYSNSPATITFLRNPDPQRENLELELGMVVRDVQMFGPILEVRRTLQCTLGQPELRIDDEVTNRGDTPAPHHWLYHCNFGYPLLDEGVRFIYGGEAEYWVVPPPAGQDIVQPLAGEAMNQLKRAPAALPEHAGGGERGLVVKVQPRADGVCRVGLINERLGIGVEMHYPAEALPRMAHWQHFGPQGSYATGLEPFYGSLFGAARDRSPLVRTQLAPGESRRYRLQIRVLRTAEELEALAACDNPLRPVTAT